jgi:hypothetical protein
VDLAGLEGPGDAVTSVDKELIREELIELNALVTAFSADGSRLTIAASAAGAR